MPGNAFIQFMKEDGGSAPGESQQIGHLGSGGWIEIGDWSWDVEAEASHLKGTGAAVGKPTSGVLSFTHYYDKSSPVLMQFIVKGTHFKCARLDMLKQKPLYEETQSIMRAARRLYDSRNYFVAGLVIFFSLVVPVIKVALLGAILAMKSPATRYRLYLFTRSISKWAMADVFAVGVFIAFLAANALDNLDAKLHPGYYFFVAYCLVSNVAFQFLHVPPPTSDAT